MGEVSPFPADALEANRAGRLTDQQRRDLRGQSRGLRKAELQFAVILTIIGLLVWFAEGPAKYATVKPLVGIACLIIAGFLVVRAFLGADPLTHDLRSTNVQSVEGAITKTSVTAHSRGTSSTSYFFIVSGTKLKVSRFEYQAAPEAGIVKVYYLPHSHQLVNMERLPDRPLPPDAFKSPQTAQDLLQGMRSHDPNQVAETRAEAAAMGNVLKAEIAKAATPLPAEAQQDQRPLAEAIVGAWDNPIMSVSFAADGTLNATMPGGRKRTGTWSIDWSGHLLSDITGPTEASVSGDQLTVKIGGQGLTFQRVTT
jgi:hypothetical protein